MRKLSCYPSAQYNPLYCFHKLLHMPLTTLEKIPIPSSGTSTQNWLTPIRSIGRRMTSFPFLQYARSGLKRFLAVAEPTRWMLMQRLPSITSGRNCDQLTIISANLWHDWPRFRALPERLEAFAQLVEEEQADVLLVQEVARTTEFSAESWLAERLGMAYVYTRANGHADNGFEEGLAVFSRFPLGDSYVRQLSEAKNPFSRRMALGVEIATPCGILTVFSTHLGLGPQQNSRQINQLQSWVKEVTADRPAVVGGDFNACERTTRMRMIHGRWMDTYRHLNPIGPAATHSLRGPGNIVWSRKRLDYIFLKNGSLSWQIKQSRHITARALPHSDHSAVLTRLVPVLS